MLYNAHLLRFNHTNMLVNDYNKLDYKKLLL